MSAITAADVDALLPQTQCTRCGYPDCAAYARAIAHAHAPINRCPPGGAATIDALSALTGQAPQPLDPECGAEAPRRVAVVDEARCIGCTICLQVCPVDAIVGAPRRMHAVLDAWCSGCDLCVAPCPVDCIVMLASPRATWSDEDAGLARQRHRSRDARIARGERIAERRATMPVPDGERARRQATVAAALARARARRAGSTA